MNKREYRRVPVQEFRVVDGTEGKEFWARVLRYGVRDDYGTRFRAGLFDTQLDGGDWPPMLYGHNWMDLEAVLGQWAERKSETAGTSLDMRGVFDDFDAVPAAKQASAQLRSRTLKEFSIGFTRLEDRRAEEDHSTIEITEAYLDEVSIVPRGAVSGTKMLSMRASGLMIPAPLAGTVLTQLAAGNLSLAEALGQLEAAGVEAPDGGTEGTTPPEGEGTTAPPEGEEGLTELDPELEAELADALGIVEELAS